MRTQLVLSVLPLELGFERPVDPLETDRDHQPGRAHRVQYHTEPQHQGHDPVAGAKERLEG